MKIRYLIRKKSADYLIFIALYEGETTELISTGQHITKAQWSATDMQPKDHRSAVFKAIEKVKTDVQKAIIRLEADGIPATPYVVKDTYKKMKVTAATINQATDKKTKADSITVIKLAQRWRDKELYRYQGSTQKSIRHSINKFIAYLKDSGLSTLERKLILPAIIGGYEKHLIEEEYADNTHGKLMKHLQWFLKWLDIDTGFIKIRSSKKTKVSLSKEELERLETVDTSDSVEKQKARDLFLLGCYTGLRISDLKRLNPVNTRDGMITMKLQKNKKHVRIPIIKSCDAILSKYNYRSPKLAEHTLNKRIKEICDKAKINELVIVETVIAGKTISKTEPKHQLVSSHVAGKTFISLAPKLWELTPAEIADIVGKDLRTLLNNYFNDQGESGRQKMIEADNRNKMKVV